ncbi:MAG: LysR family transcriptional regulator [marine bacterium B5-7]|nr:MAG: LysR family transcriptional regulator [marine bacterium B5-7]
MRDLRITLAVADNGGILKAAESLNITQPTVTRCVHDLESRLGVSLFHRTSRGVTLTPYGETFVQRGRQIVADVGMLGAEIDAMAHGTKGQVHVGVMPAAINTIVPQALLELQRSYPDISVLVQEGSEVDLLSGLRKRSIDMAIGRLPSERDNLDVCNEVLLNDPLCFVVRLDHPMLSEKRPTVAQSVLYPWIFPERNSLVHRALESAFRTSGHELPKVAIYSTSITCIARVVAESDYIGPLPLSMFRYGARPTSFTQLNIDLPSTISPIGITKLRDRETLPSARRLEDALRSVCLEKFNE